MRAKGTVSLILLFMTTMPVFAQDSHYWTLQYGPKSSLLGGSVIGSIDDISATYYNPGALSLASDLSFAMSVDVVEYSKIRLEDGGGNGIDLGTTQSGFRPSIVAAALNKETFGGVLALSILTRTRGTQDYQGVNIREDINLNSFSNPADIVGMVRFEGEFNDLWGGLSYSKKIGPKVGIGGTWYLAYRTQRRREETIGESVDTEGNSLAYINIDGGRINTLRTLLKLGVFAKSGRISGGLTLTTPGLQLYGRGEMARNLGFFGTDTSALAASIQPGLSAKYNSPLSIGLGIGIELEKAKIHISAEWFDNIDPYTVVQGEEFLAQYPDSQIFQLDAVQELNALLNWGLGVEYKLSETMIGFASYNTDRSAISEEIERAALSTFPININNANIGVLWSLSRTKLTLGAGFSWGREEDKRLTEVLREENEDFKATFVGRGYRILFGIEFGLN